MVIDLALLLQMLFTGFFPTKAENRSKLCTAFLGRDLRSSAPIFKPNYISRYLRLVLECVNNLCGSHHISDVILMLLANVKIVFTFKKPHMSDVTVGE